MKKTLKALDGHLHGHHLQICTTSHDRLGESQIPEQSILLCLQ